MSVRGTQGNYSIELAEIDRLASEAKLNQSRALKASTGGMSGAVLNDAVPGEDAVGMSSSNLQVASAKNDPAKAKNASFGPPLPPGAGPNYTAPAFGLPETMFSGMNTSGPMDMAGPNFAVNPFEDAYAANPDAGDAPALVSDVSGLSFGGGDGEVEIKNLAVPIGAFVEYGFCLLVAVPPRSLPSRCPRLALWFANLAIS